MKKAKVFLSAFAVLALVAGALAFKANKFSGTVFCTSATGKTAGTTACPAFTPSTYGSSGTQSFCTVTINTTCGEDVFKPIRN
jgi:hypothetical protein